MKKSVKNILIIFFILIISLFLTRLINPTEIDDISPGINCPEIEKYNPDTLYVIPNYNSNAISYNEEWCNYILSLNKTLALHGITHTYREFLHNNISQKELDFGISEFEKCFGFEPEIFKSPQMKINKENKKIIKENNLKLRTKVSQITHKVYHCSDSDRVPNKIVHIF